MGSQNANGTTFPNGLASVISVPISKSSAVASYDILSKTKAKQIEVNIENLPVKYFNQYRIGCLKDGSTENILSGLGIFTLNIFGAFTETEIDYPDHWFLIAKASNWTNDIDEIISYTREIIEEKKKIERMYEVLPKFGNELTENIFRIFIKLIEDSTKKINDLFKKYSNKCQCYFSKNHENEFEKFCGVELFKIYLKLKKNNDIQTTSKYIDEFEKKLSKKENKVYYLIEKGSNAKGITKHDNIDDIFKIEKENYHYNKIEFMKKYSLKRKITIKDINDYVKTLSDSYNLIDDNCQTFVRNILAHFT